jgi:hypothetical protein
MAVDISGFVVAGTTPRITLFSIDTENFRRYTDICIQKGNRRRLNQ